MQRRKDRIVSDDGTGEGGEARFRRPGHSRGFQVYPGFFYDTGIGTRNGIPGLLDAASSPVGPAKPTAELDVDHEELAAPNPLGDSVYRNLSTFSGRGGKLIFYHGGSDPWFPAWGIALEQRPPWIPSIC